MSGYLPPRGLIVELITPLNSKFSLSNNDLIAHLTNIRPFVDAIMILSPEGGEGFEISLKDKKELLGICTEVVKEEIPLFIFVTSDTEDETIENISTFNKLLNEVSYKGEIFWVDAPLYYHSNRGLPTVYKRIVKTGVHPMILYNNPRIVEKVRGPFNRKNIRTSVLKELSLIEQIKGLIFIGDLKRALNYQKAVEERAYFRIYDGDERLFLNFPNKNGLLSLSANLIPYVWKSLINRDPQTDVREIWYVLKEFSEILVEGGPALIKKVLHKEGILKTFYCNTTITIDEILLEKTHNLFLRLKAFYEKKM